MAKNAAQHGYPPISETPISKAEALEAEASGTPSSDRGETARSGKGASAPESGPAAEKHGGKTNSDGIKTGSGGLRRRFLRTLGTLVALAGLALVLLAGLDVGSGQLGGNPSDSTGTRSPQETEENRPEDTAPPEEPSTPSGSESSKAKSPEEKHSEAESSEAESFKRKSSQSQPGRRSYSYLGSVSRSVPETRAIDNGTGAERGSASETESPAGAKGQGDSPTQSSGRVPELTIRLGERSIEEVAAKFGYQMVAIGPSGNASSSSSSGKDSPESVVLGKIENGRLESMKKTELKQYAGRARSARRHPEYDRLRRRVARRLPGRGAGAIRLIYLVPKKVEQAFVQAQMEAIRERGLAPEEVAVVKARYKGDAIEVTDIERKSGSQAGPR
jgi:hypothetical protein